MNAVGAQIQTVLAELVAEGGFVLGDSAASGGLGGSTAGLAGATVISTPIGGRSALGLGLGLAMAGKPVVVELSSASELDFSLLSDAVRPSDFPLRLVIRIGSGGQSGTLDALTLPLGVSVWASSGPNAAAVLGHCLKGGVHVVLESRTAYGRRCEPTDAPDHRVHREGAYATIATWGAGVSAALEAADALAQQGISTSVLELLQLQPVPDALTTSVVSTGRLVVAHPGAPALAASIQARVLQGAFLYLESPLSDCSIQSTDVVAAVRRSVDY